MFAQHVGIVVAVVVLCSSGGHAGSLDQALSGGETQFKLRYRYELVDQDGFDADANASTLLARLGYTSGSFSDWQLGLEFDAVTTIAADRYNSGAGTSSARRNRFPVVADPDYAEVNQAYLQYRGWPVTVLRAGRQRINLDDQRFVGGVGWRQNEQTYDSVSLQYAPESGPALFYAWVGNVNRIFGDDVPAGDHDSSTHLLNARFGFDAGRLVVYHYAIDNEDAPAASSATSGVRFDGQAEPAGRTLRYRLEYATQRDAADNPVDFDASYWRLDASIGIGGVEPAAGVEVLSGDAGRAGAAFRTPLATLHAFNGWADQFLTTPDAGLVDWRIGARGKLGSWSWQTWYHRFDSEAGSIDYGTEFDLALSRQFGDPYSLLLKAALFDADTSALADTRKAWLMFTASF